MLPDTTLGLFITTNVLAYLELDPLDQITFSVQVGRHDDYVRQRSS